MEQPTDLRTEVAALIAAAEQLWRNYLEVGPGGLAESAWQPVDAARRRLEAALAESSAAAKAAPPDDWLAAWAAEWEVLAKLLLRCVHRSEGLSFVTGEAGLIPRRDLHERCTQAIAQLRQLSTRLP